MTSRMIPEGEKGLSPQEGRTAGAVGGPKTPMGAARAAPQMYDALDMIFSLISYINIHGVGDQPPPRDDGLPQVKRASIAELGSILARIGTLASGALALAEQPVEDAKNRAHSAGTPQP